MNPRNAESMISVSVEKQYNDLDEFFRETWGTSLHHGLWVKGDETLAEAKQQLQGLVIDHLSLVSGEEILDVGGGYGALAQRLHRAHSCKVDVVTNSSKQAAFILKEVESGGGEGRVNAILGDWNVISKFLDKRYDRVIAIESLEHMSDIGLAFSKMLKTLKVGGRFLVTTWRSSMHREKMPTSARHVLSFIEGAGALAVFAPVESLLQETDTSLIGECKIIDLTDAVRKTWKAYPEELIRNLISRPKIFIWLMTHPALALKLSVATWLTQWAYSAGYLKYYLIKGKRLR